MSHKFEIRDWLEITTVGLQMERGKTWRKVEKITDLLHKGRMDWLSPNRSIIPQLKLRAHRVQSGGGLEQRLKGRGMMFPVDLLEQDPTRIWEYSRQVQIVRHSGGTWGAIQRRATHLGEDERNLRPGRFMYAPQIAGLLEQNYFLMSPLP